MRSLDLSSNQLTALPEALGQFRQLPSLNLTDNRLTALPESLGQREVTSDPVVRVSRLPLPVLNADGDMRQGVYEFSKSMIDVVIGEGMTIGDWMGTSESARLEQR